MCFKSGEFKESGEDSWTANAANLRKLNNCMEAYLDTVLKLPIEKNYIDTQAIAKEDDRINMLRLVFCFP